LPPSDAAAAPRDGSLPADAADASDGSQGSDGDAAETPDAPPGCLVGTVTFDLRPAAGSPKTYCLGAPGSCVGGWLSILTADGSESLSLVHGCVPDCSDCQPVSCPLVCVAPLALGDAGVHLSWDGRFVEHLTCGASVACAHPACAPAGHYVARMCGYSELAEASSMTPTCQGSPTPTCTDVPFAWPPPSGASSVVGVIGAARADAGTSD
jgi:hypothetical protein